MQLFINVHPDHETTDYKWRISNEAGEIFHAKSLELNVFSQSDFKPEWGTGGGICLTARGHLTITNGRAIISGTKLA